MLNLFQTLFQICLKFKFWLFKIAKIYKYRLESIK